jgi:hypothetical protein
MKRILMLDKESFMQYQHPYRILWHGRILLISAHGQVHSQDL